MTAPRPAGREIVVLARLATALHAAGDHATALTIARRAVDACLACDADELNILAASAITDAALTLGAPDLARPRCGASAGRRPWLRMLALNALIPSRLTEQILRTERWRVGPALSALIRAAAEYLTPDHLDQATAVAAELDDTHKAATLIGDIAMARFRLGDPDAAIRASAEAIRLARWLGRDQLLGIIATLIPHPDPRPARPSRLRRRRGADCQTNRVLNRRLIPQRAL